MKLLIDENLPVDLRHFLAEHQAFTVAFMGWKGLRNGELLARAGADAFDAVLIRDSGIEYQQNLTNLPVSAVMSRSTRRSWRTFFRCCLGCF